MLKRGREMQLDASPWGVLHPKALSPWCLQTPLVHPEHCAAATGTGGCDPTLQRAPVGAIPFLQRLRAPGEPTRCSPPTAIFTLSSPNPAFNSSRRRGKNKLKAGFWTLTPGRRGRARCPARRRCWWGAGCRGGHGAAGPCRRHRAPLGAVTGGTRGL